MTSRNISRQLLPLVKPEPHLASQHQEIGKRNKQLVQCSYRHHQVSLAQNLWKTQRQLCLTRNFTFITALVLLE